MEKEKIYYEIIREKPDKKILDMKYVKGYIKPLRYMKSKKELEIYFHKGSKDIICQFFMKDENGKDIIPNDGTYLLPYDYYFNINIYKKNSNSEKEYIIQDESVITQESIDMLSNPFLSEETFDEPVKFITMNDL